MDAEDRIVRLVRPRLKPWRWRPIESSEALVGQVITQSEARLPTAKQVWRNRRRALKSFSRNLHQQYGRAFRYSVASVQASTEAVLVITPVLAHHESQIQEAGAAFQLQHAQAVRASWECLELLFRGYGYGALAHSRTVLELSIAVQALVKTLDVNPQSDVAKRFFDHEELVRARQALEHDKFALLLGHEKDDPANQAAAREVVESYRSRLGSDGIRQFQKDWGWLGGVSGAANPGLVEVSRHVDMEGWYDYYRYASNITHGGTRGPILNRAKFRGDYVPFYGPSNLYLTDPAQITLLRLTAASAAIVSFAIAAAAAADFEADELLADRRLRQMHALAMLEYARKMNVRAIDEFFFVEGYIERMEGLADAPRFRRAAAWARHQCSRAVRTFYKSSSRP